MIAVQIPDAQDSSPRSTPLEVGARTLAETHSHLERAPLVTQLFETPPFSRRLARAYKRLALVAPTEGESAKAAEWFLDNYYLIRRVARQVEEELPRGFVRHLPRLSSGKARGQPRIDTLARALIHDAELVLDAGILRRFVDAYQEVSPLTIAELWALPTLLRAAVLQHLLHFLDELGVGERQGGTLGLPRVFRNQAAAEPLAIEAGLGVERSVRALRVLDVIDWKAFFERANRVEAILRTDPAGVYSLMDFPTCDSYRKVIEALAWSTGMAEEAVAKAAIDLARDAPPSTRPRHVGYFIVAEGRPSLEHRIRYRLRGLALARRVVTSWPTVSYAMPLALVTAFPLLAVGWALGDRIGILGALAIVLLGAVPVSSIAVAIVQLAFARLLPPRTLPKLDFRAGIPTDARTIVVIPTQLGRATDVTSTLRRLELHYLSNPDPALAFALLTDDVDRPSPPEQDEKENPLVEQASRGIALLNTKHGKSGAEPFHLLHRRSQWNAAEGRFMGWERKRGKLEELNRLLRGDTATSYSVHVGDPKGLLGIRFVITLDSDTELPMGSAHRLVGILAHPLNHAVTDERTGRVVAGYTVVQPRVETSPSSSRSTLFSRLFAGDVGFDIYTHACSELYQDLFGAGIYVGKGIYDVDAFSRSIEGRVPENALVSHDLFEGIQGRTALATDVLLFESYPSNYATFAARMHRWVRGDWQLVPWLFSRVPTADGRGRANTLAAIDRWKIADNLRRSLSGPLLLALAVVGWVWSPRSAPLSTLTLIALLLAPLLPTLLGGRRAALVALGRFAFAVTFLAYESCVVVDAVARVIVRTTITKKLLLQWTSMAQAASSIEARSPRAMFWRTMSASPLVAIAVVTLLVLLSPTSLLAAAPVLALWMLAPEIARWISRVPDTRIERMTPGERGTLRLLARRTWHFFETFVGPDDQWLPVDNYQEEPCEQTAHRTSPTNIGLMLLATLSAYDFGYIGPSELSLRLRRAFETITRLRHYQGHLLNWYDTRNLQPLLPQYVSTVDSGNFAGCLWALKHGCEDVATLPVVRVEAWEGLSDSVDLLCGVIDEASLDAADSLRAVLDRIKEVTLGAPSALHDVDAALRMLCDDTSSELDRELRAFIEAGRARHDADALSALRAAIDGLHRQLSQMRRELDMLLPWVALHDEASLFGITLPDAPRLGELPALAENLRAALEDKEAERRARGEMNAELVAAACRLRDAFTRSAENAGALLGEFVALGARADEEARGMDFKLLYDSERKLFHIGYNATQDLVDTHHYDLLASEARLASYVAIVKRDVPEAHWYALGRPMTRVGGAPALVSWGGTMFEYLMPGLLMRSEPGTLIAQTSELAVAAQIAYARHEKEPWGISESAYARVDADETYQYRSFGVPGLGFKRGLEDDRVITPYASLLAASIRPRAVVANVRVLEAMGMLGNYGLFEALDLTPERALTVAPNGQRVSVVRSYMAHHQGMVLVALGNLLNRRSMVDRFHADALVATGEALLNEHAPDTAPPEWPLAEEGRLADTAHAAQSPRAPGPWLSADQAGPQAFALSNGRLTSLLTASGGGGLSWQGLALTRYEPDPTLDDEGLWFYLKDDETGRVWRATSPLGRTTYEMHRVEFHRREEGISTHVEVAIAPSDDVEVRLVTLHNETNRPRRLTLTSAARPVLFDAKQAPSHPAFSGMFVVSERVKDLDGLLFTRRPQKPEEEPAVLVHRLVREGPLTTFAGFEGDRGAFFGRGHSRDLPEALTKTATNLGGSVGAVLDPLMSLSARVDLRAKGAVTLAFVTSIARTRRAATDLARKYGSMHAVRWAVRDAEQDSPRRLERTRVEPALVPAIQRFFSAMLFADPNLRAPSAARAASPPCQRRLWGRGISGDDPIVVVRVHDAQGAILGDVISAQRYLRSCGVRLDLVLLDEQPTGYASEASGTIRAVLVEHDVLDWQNRRGGIYVVALDQIPDSERLHLEACARVILDTRDPTLAARLAHHVAMPPALPRFEPTLRAEPLETAGRPRGKLAFDNGTGGFTEDGREYVLELSADKPTPAPWCNVLANPEFGCLVSESSLGATWSQNSGENRLTPWRNDAVFDTPSEALYLRDEETAVIWSTTPLPAGQSGRTLVRHGAGYTVYERESNGLVQELTVFVPQGAPLKVVRLRLKNTLGRRRRLTATYYAEWVLGVRRETQRPFVVSEFDRDRACLLARCDWSEEFSGRVAFLASGGKAHGFTADRTEFMGKGGDYARPDALQRWGLSGRTDLGADPCAALQTHLDLGPGQEIETHFILGQAQNRQEALDLVARFRDPSVVATAFKELAAYWDGILGAIRVKTPEPAMDVLLNRWLLYQALSSRVFGRTAFYQSSGAFGYRDQLQDVMAFLHAAPAVARAHILDAARHQFEEGDVLHWWHPPSGRGVRTRCSDDLAWLPYVTAEYVAQTGDATILDESVPFLHGDPLRADEHDRYAQYEMSTASASLFEHCKRAIEHAATAGAHGLPLMGDGDWNDGMNRVGAKGRGESVWLGWFLSATMDRLAALAAKKNDELEARRWRARAEVLRAKIAEVAWDGDWYLRAFHDDGSLVGSSKSKECKIDSISQSWAVMARPRGDVDDARARMAVRSADERLVQEADRLVLLFSPPYDGSLHDPGYVAAYPPGVRENGGQYTHAATWLGVAHAGLGDGAGAERIFRLLNPILRAATPDGVRRYRIEPYALAGDIYNGPPLGGRGGWSWYTGAAAWMWRLGVEAILGLQRDDGRLRIDPCVPPTWPRFEAWVRDGQRTLHIVVENPDGVARGVASVTVDGVVALGQGALKLDGATSGTHEIEVRLGSGSPAMRPRRHESREEAL